MGTTVMDDHFLNFNMDITANGTVLYDCRLSEYEKYSKEYTSKHGCVKRCPCGHMYIHMEGTFQASIAFLQG